MRLLLDECLPRPLKRCFDRHDAWTVPEMGWAGLRNGELLRQASTRFDVFLTIDAGIWHQQNLAGVALAVVVLRAPSNRFVDLEPLVAEAQRVLPSTVPGRLYEVGSTPVERRPDP